jgi:hypothetical protein
LTAVLVSSENRLLLRQCKEFGALNGSSSQFWDDQQVEDFDILVALENAGICSLRGEVLEEEKVCCHSKSVRKTILEQKGKSA